MRIIINSRQQCHSIRVPALRQVVAQLAGRALKSRAARASGPPWREIAVTLVDDAGMVPINRRIMGRAEVTDVITQRYANLPGEPPGLVADLIVNVERAWQVGGGRTGWSASRELALYLAHGCDHLNDEDDATPAGCRRMRQRELRWLRSLRLPVLLS